MSTYLEGNRLGFRWVNSLQSWTWPGDQNGHREAFQRAFREADLTGYRHVVRRAWDVWTQRWVWVVYKTDRPWTLTAAIVNRMSEAGYLL